MRGQPFAPSKRALVNRVMYYVTRYFERAERVHVRTSVCMDSFAGVDSRTTVSTGVVRARRGEREGMNETLTAQTPCRGTAGRGGPSAKTASAGDRVGRGGRRLGACWRHTHHQIRAADYRELSESGAAVRTKRRPVRCRATCSTRMTVTRVGLGRRAQTLLDGREKSATRPAALARCGELECGTFQRDEHSSTALNMLPSSLKGC